MRTLFTFLLIVTGCLPAAMFSAGVKLQKKIPGVSMVLLLAAIALSAPYRWVLFFIGKLHKLKQNSILALLTAKRPFPPIF